MVIEPCATQERDMSLDQQGGKLEKEVSAGCPV